MKLKHLAAIAAMAVMLPAAAQAQWWHKHPGYPKAMSDLRTAYWLVQHHGTHNPVANDADRAALHAIHAAYDDLRTASIMDDRSIDDQPPADMTWGDHRSRLHQAKELLQDAHGRIEGEEADPSARGLRHRAGKHIDAAINALNDAMHSWHFF